MQKLDLFNAQSFNIKFNQRLFFLSMESIALILSINLSKLLCIHDLAKLIKFVFFQFFDAFKESKPLHHVFLLVLSWLLALLVLILLLLHHHLLLLLLLVLLLLIHLDLLLLLLLVVGILLSRHKLLSLVLLIKHLLLLVVIKLLDIVHLVLVLLLLHLHLVELLVLHFYFIHLVVSLVFHFFLLFGLFVALDACFNVVVQFFAFLIGQLIKVKLQLLFISLLVLGLVLLYDRNYTS